MLTVPNTQQMYEMFNYSMCQQRGDLKVSLNCKSVMDKQGQSIKLLTFRQQHPL